MNKKLFLFLLYLCFIYFIKQKKKFNILNDKIKKQNQTLIKSNVNYIEMNIKNGKIEPMNKINNLSFNGWQFLQIHPFKPNTVIMYKTQNIETKHISLSDKIVKKYYEQYKKQYELVINKHKVLLDNLIINIYAFFEILSEKLYTYCSFYKNYIKCNGWYGTISNRYLNKENEWFYNNIIIYNIKTYLTELCSIVNNLSQTNIMFIYKYIDKHFDNNIKLDIHSINNHNEIFTIKINTDLINNYFL